MAAPTAPALPVNKSSGNPHPRRGQIKAKIVRDLISAVASIASAARNRGMAAAAAAAAGGAGASGGAAEASAAPPPERQLPIAVV